MKPEVKKYPIEVFGYSYNDNSAKAVEARKNQYCPFLKKECTKPRKSEPHIKVGICSLGYKGSFLGRYEPVIVCPSRFLEEVVFTSIHDRFFPDWDHYAWIKEVNMGVSGNVDYVALKTNSDGKNATDFFCVEFQANGTTGSPYPYVEDLLNNGTYKKKHSFGLNWANEFMKTMMQQVYKKGQAVEAWGKKIVFVIQDVSLEYLENTVDTSDLRQNIDDVVHFMTYKMVWNETEDKFSLVADRWVSTDLNGINKILAGANPEKYLTSQDFLNNAIRKGQEDNVFK